MHDEELAVLRRELAGIERGPGKVYSEELKARLTAWARRRVAAGTSVTAAAHAVALHPRTLTTWLERQPPVAPHRRAPPVTAPVSLVPVAIIEPAPTATTVTLVSPSGYRLEGLPLDEALRALARLR